MKGERMNNRKISDPGSNLHHAGIDNAEETGVCVKTPEGVVAAVCRSATAENHARVGVHFRERKGRAYRFDRLITQSRRQP